ncbi:hypothetical protein DFJ58DRAFT_633951, partial [Suillus subalutaceus]|uniref:uncharacterized protein n=1 Tax=Suillus subalutaceus TaxID=48586 RepID=UPI001B86D3A0
DPNKQVVPDYTLEEHQPARQQLIAEGFTDDQAARSLTSLWTLTNNAAKERWATRQQRLEAIRQQDKQDKQDKEDRQQALKDEEEAVRLEEQKKNKSKYAPIKRGKVPSDPSIIPAAYAIRKMKVGDFCELHYFRNRGCLSDAKAAVLIAEPEALVMLPEANGAHTWVPAAAVRDPKASAVVRDENLSWEEFNEAASRMISMM